MALVVVGVAGCLPLTVVADVSLTFLTNQQVMSVLIGIADGVFRLGARDVQDVRQLLLCQVRPASEGGSAARLGGPFDSGAVRLGFLRTPEFSFSEPVVLFCG
ncbi:hypothetical protein [Streptomyces sp. NPDC001275]